MNPDQTKAHAAGFLHALAIDPDLAARWQANIPNAERAQMIAQHLGLAEAPSEGDLQAMTDYATTHLSDAVAKATPSGVTAMSILTQQS
jgi:DNA-binding GntR family transcriptional regulator